MNKSAEGASHNVAIATAGTVLYEDGESFFTGSGTASIYFYTTIGIKPVSELLNFYNQRKMIMFNRSITNNTHCKNLWYPHTCWYVTYSSDHLLLSTAIGIW